MKEDHFSVTHTDAEWRKQLNAEQFAVTRHADTEMPFQNKYWDMHADGIFSCICCATPLFARRSINVRRTTRR